ncbi:uncharacterized protein Triagg1_6410 [Trichoderma aggressivum f. europaeum]|uniref:SRR1-like domain-containing protein n=1 Tax=Trichoderma aggressivum f. europaeum TaxID=173218 RepID=A0AAE1ICW8_9HYPO|nr:hypothetical protein Triagg1_6410 [Trichoderma aggressivum f. europaeum]
MPPPPPPPQSLQLMNNMQASEEWTVVRRRSRRIQGLGPGPYTLPDAARAVPHLAVEEMQKDFDNYNAQFKASNTAKTLHDTIKEFASDALNVNNEKPVTKAISLGIGSFDPADGSPQLKRRAHMQLAAMLHMVSLLEENTSSGQIKCTFQEPLFTPSDIAFLTAMGHEVVESPVASNSVTAGTLFFGPHLYKEVYGMALKGEIPVVWVGTDWVVWEKANVSQSKEEENHLGAIKKMHETYKHVPFPDDENNTIFYGTCLYLKYPEHPATAKLGLVNVQDEPGDKTYTFNVQREQRAQMNYITIEDDDEPAEMDDVHIKQEHVEMDNIFIKQEPFSD